MKNKKYCKTVTEHFCDTLPYSWISYSIESITINDYIYIYMHMHPYFSF